MSAVTVKNFRNSQRVATSSRCWRGEPPLSELLDDPIMHLVMARDRICVDDVHQLMASVRVRIGDGEGSLSVTGGHA